MEDTSSLQELGIHLCPQIKTKTSSLVVWSDIQLSNIQLAVAKEGLHGPHAVSDLRVAEALQYVFGI